MKPVTNNDVSPLSHTPLGRAYSGGVHERPNQPPLGLLGDGDIELPVQFEQEFLRDVEFGLCFLRRLCLVVIPRCRATRTRWLIGQLDEDASLDRLPVKTVLADKKATARLKPEWIRARHLRSGFRDQ